MFSPDNSDYTTTTGPIDRSVRAANRREIINEKRQKHTDMLPIINGEMSNGKPISRQIAQLREENKRLHRELDEQQHLNFQYRQTRVQLKQKIDNIHSSKQHEIEQYEIHLRDAIEERNQLQETNQELKRRYEELDHSFNETVTEEANKMVAEAVDTIVLTPEHTPPLLRDVAKTVELHMKQTEDHHVAELLSLMRQAQYKAELLEQELAKERENIADERQNLLAQQARISEQAHYRYTTMQKHVQARWTLIMTLIAAFLLVLVTIFQRVFVSLEIPVDIAIFAPVIICIVVAFLIARAYTDKKLQEANKKLVPKTTITPTKTSTPAVKKA